MSNLTNIVIGLVVVGLLLTRQLQARPAKETSSIRIVLILGLIGIFEMKGATGSHRVTAAPIAWLVLSLLAGAGMGAVRGATVRIWRAETARPGGRERYSPPRCGSSHWPPTSSWTQSSTTPPPSPPSGARASWSTSP
jgi:hypothetical protein